MAARCLEQRGATVQRFDIPSGVDRDGPATAFDIRLGDEHASLAYYSDTAKASNAERLAEAQQGGASPVQVLGREGRTLLLGLTPLSDTSRGMMIDCALATGRGN